MATLLFGDSIAKGITYHDKRLSMTSKSIVEAIENDFGIVIKDYSIYGQTLKRLHDRNIIKHEVEQLDLSDKHYCAIAVGGNDADFNWKEVSSAPLVNHEPKTPLSLFEELLTHYVLYLKDKGITVMLFTTVPLISRRYFDEVITKIGEHDHIMQFFNQDVEMISRHHEAYSHIIMKVAYHYECILIDIRTSLLNHNRFNDLLSADGVHPNQKGYDLIYSHIKDTITKDSRLIDWTKTRSK